jgi:hypothetical protein
VLLRAPEVRPGQCCNRPLASQGMERHAERGTSILLPMQIDPVQEWRRLTENYREMPDVQLEELALDFADLTAAAQQALRDELRHRGLPQPGSSPQATATRQAPVTPRLLEPTEDEFENREDSEEDSGEPHEYTWKTVLCECEERDQIWQLQEMLHRAGIDSWRQGADEAGLLYPRILVAADQLEEARIVIARPVPQDVIDQSHEPTQAEYEMPRCPACRAEDPVLEDTEPVNSWRCEACGRQWSDPAPAAEGEPQQTPM